MKRRTFNRVHKWLALSASLFLTCWLVSGLVMIIPIEWLKPWGRNSTPEAVKNHIGFRDVTVSVPEAITAASVARDARVEVQEVKLKRLGESLVYEISTLRHGTILVNALDRKAIVADERWAERLAREWVARDAELLEVSRVEEPSFFYHGQTPAFRFRFGDAEKSQIHVALTDGRVHKSTRLSRLHRSVTSLHTLEPALSLLSRRRHRVAILAAGTLLSIAALCTGLYLSLPARRRT